MSEILKAVIILSTSSFHVTKEKFLKLMLNLIIQDLILNKNINTDRNS